jgi:ABC-2 type transport system ATP-binding protein
MADSAEAVRPAAGRGGPGDAGGMTRTAGLAAQVRGLCKHYDGVPALRGIDLEVGHGEVLALLGPNGAGKTTALEIMAGYRRPDAGTARVLGTDPAARGRAGRALRARIGIVAQSGSGLPDLAITRILAHFASYYPAPLTPARALALVGLGEQAAARPGQLSGGQRRRLDVAIGVIGGPELLFLDEPTTGFDPEARREFWGLIRDLQDSGTTIVLTTHYLEEAEALADRVGVIAQGRLIAVDTPRMLGHRDSALATVSWRTPEGAWERMQSATPTAFVADLAARYDGEVPGLTVTRPTLEDVYLEMIGMTERTERSEGHEGMRKIGTTA